MSFRRLALALIVCLAATWGWSAYALLRSDEGSDDRLDASPKELVVQHATSGPPAPVRLMLRNDGDHPVRILDAESTCGCTVPDLSNQVTIAPGDEFVMTVSGTPPGIGEKTAYLTIRTDSPTQPALRVPVLLKGKPLAVPYISAMPEQFDLRTTRPEPVSHEFTVHTVEAPGSQPWLNTPAAALDHGELKLLDMTDEPGPAGSSRRSYRFRITGLEPSQDGAPQMLQLRLGTTAPAQSEPRPIRVTYRLVPAVRAVPEELFFDRGHARNGLLEKPILFVTEHDRPVRVTADASNVKWLNVASIEPSAGGSLAGRTTASVDPALLPAGVTEATLLFRTDHPDRPTVHVPIHVR